MKIRPTQSPQQVVLSERESGGRATELEPSQPRQPAAQVTRSAFARALEATGPDSIRHDLVAEVRAQLADGTFEANVDMDGTLDSLLADL